MLALVTAFVTALFTPAVRAICRGAGWVDHPDSRRKLHRTPVPRIGGIALVLAWAAAVMFASLSDDAGEHRFATAALRLAPAVLVVFAGGLYDDFFRLSAWQKLWVQAVAGGCAYAAGIRLDIIAGRHAPPIVALPLTIIWLAAVSNAFNLMDGLDGLAAGLGFLISAAISAAGYVLGDPVLAITGIIVASSLGAFLIYNAPEASIFMGDCGSLTVGFLLGCVSIVWARLAAPASILGPVILLAVPLADTSLAILRRLVRGRSPFHPDAGHIHHRLLQRGLSVPRVLAVLYAAMVASALLAIWVTVAPSQYPAVIVLFAALLFLGIRALNYSELGALASVLAVSGLRRRIRAQTGARDLEAALADCADTASSLIQLAQACQEAGLEVTRGPIEAKRGASPLLTWSDPDGTWMVEWPAGKKVEFDSAAELLDVINRHLSRGRIADPEIHALQPADSLRMLAAQIDSAKTPVLDHQEAENPAAAEPANLP